MHSLSKIQVYMVWREIISVFDTSTRGLWKDPLDPVLCHVLSFLGIYDLHAYVVTQILVFFLGCFFLYTRKKEASLLSSLWFSLVALLLVLVISGLSWGTAPIQWFPWLLFSLLLLKQKPYIFSLAIVSVFSILWSVSSGNLVAWGGIIAWLIAFIHPVKEISLHAAWGGVIMFVVIACGIALIPDANALNLSTNAQLAPTSVLSSMPRPIFGDRLQNNPLIFSILKQNLLYSGAAYFALLLPVFFAQKGWKDYYGWSLLILAGLFILLPCVITEDNYRYTPFELMVYWIPGLAHESLPWRSAALLVVVGIWGLRKVEYSAVFFNIVFKSLFFIFTVAVGIASYVDKLPFTSTITVFGNSSMQGLVSPVYLPKAATSWIASLYGDWIYDEEKILVHAIMDYGDPIPHTFLKASANENNEKANLAIDGNEKTRWTTLRIQKPGDEFYVELEKETPIIAIELYIKRNQQDFPRGLEIDVAAVSGSYKKVFRQDEWLGAVYWSETGIPWLGSKSKVIVRLPEVVLAKKIRLTQTSSTETHFWWSINEINLYGPVEKQAH